MDIFNLNFQNGELNISLNIVAFAIIVFALILTGKLLLYLQNRFYPSSTLEVDEISLGIGDSSITLKFNSKDRQIAYQIWVEMATRKVGLPFDSNNDVISEVYDSWYEFFKITRELIKDIPVTTINKKSDAETLVSIATKVLNLGMRPHLTKWQAKFRSWYDKNIELFASYEPQVNQKLFPGYEDLISDIKRTNGHLINYRKLMYKIAFGKDEIINIITEDLLSIR